MIGWLLVLSFLLGFGLTALYMIRTVTRTVTPIPSRAPRTGNVSVHSRIQEEEFETARRGPAGASRVEEDELIDREPAPRGRRRGVVEFEDEGDVYGR